MIKVKCKDLGSNFNGLVEINGEIKEIKGIYPLEEGIVFKDKNGGYKLERISKKSMDRNNVLCPNFLVCGGCHALEYNYQKQLEYKKKYINDCLRRERIKLSFSDGILGMDDPYYYRHKVIASFKTSKSNRLVLGLYEESTHKVIPYEKCILQAKEINEVLKDIVEIGNELKLTAYDGKNGFLKHVLIRSGYVSKEILVCIVTNDEFFPGRKEFIKRLLKKNEKIKTIVQNYNPRNTSIVLGERENVLFGDGYITDYIGKYKFRISSKSFYQVNPEMMIKLYEKALELGKVDKKVNLLDAYSGIGTISLLAAEKAKMVVSVENNKMANRDAIINSKINGMKNIDFILEDATKFMEDCFMNKIKFDVVILDPPREGASYKFIRNMMKINPERIVYISCNPESLARDLKILSEEYKVDYIKAFDLFPHTSHVESVCLLTRVQK